MEPRSVPPKSRNMPALFLGLLIGVVVAGVGALFYVNRSGLDMHMQDSAAASFDQLERKSGDIKQSELVVELQHLQELIQQQSSFERAATLQHAISDARPEVLVALFAHADDLPKASQRDDIQRALVRQLSQLDPKATLNHIDALPEVRRNHLIGIVFQEWSVVDLEKAIGFAVELQNGHQTAALEGILRSRIDLSETARWEIARQLGNEQLILDQWARIKGQEAIDDPLSAWGDFLTVHGSDFEGLSPDQRSLLVNIALAWIGRDGFVDVVQGMSMSLADYGSSISLVEFVLEDLIADDPTLVVEAASSMSEEVRSIVRKALANLAARHPEKAFEIAVMMEGSSNQVVLQRAAIRAWIQADPKAVLEARDGLPLSFKPWIEQSALMSMVKTLPEEVPPFIPTITDKTQMEIVVINLGLNWARKDPMAVFEWLQSEPEAKPWYGHVLDDVIENLTKQDPQQAMRFALELPTDEYYDGVGWEVSVVWTVAQRDIDAALELIDHARDEKTRDYMLMSIGAEIRNRGQYKRAMDWAENLKEASREKYYENVVLGWAANNAESLYANMDTLPSDHIKEYAANLLIILNEPQRAFTE